MTSDLPPRPTLPSRPELPEGVQRDDLEVETTAAHDDLPPWPFWLPLAALAMTLTVALVALIGFSALSQMAGQELAGNRRPWQVIVASGITQQLAMIAASLAFARAAAGRVSLADFGIRRTALLPAIGWTLATWFTFLLFTAAYATALGIENVTDEMPERLGANQSIVAAVAVTFMATVMAPVAEELFFRGFFFTAVRRLAGVVGGAVATGILFGLVHFGSDPRFLVPLGVFGALLCLLYWKTGSLIPCMALHALNNSIAVGRSLEWHGTAIVATMLASTLTIIGVSILLSRTRPVATPART
ncbi:MAG: CPBP family intramembrane metalloprotease [Actinomycetota bacterium]|nr:CPBP family intramembrane metalloprotease [Actinomycetota bacterium]